MPSSPRSRLVRLAALLGAMILVVLAWGCASPKRYNSLDLALLPCERGASAFNLQGEAPRFFRAIEFDEEGRLLFPKQFDELKARLRSGTPVTDLVFFLHGWNKNPSSAETDYQDFLCRFHAYLPRHIDAQKRLGGLVVVGIFWPSTITDQDHEPLLLMPMSYFRIRERADRIARTGLATLFHDLTGDLHNNTRLQLIGHSFGGRMLVQAARKLSEEGQLVPFLGAPQSVDLVLLNAAISPASFAWLDNEVQQARTAGRPVRFGRDTTSYLFNLHSFNDSANRVLFRLASTFTDDEATCAAGACGVQSYATLCVDNSGQVRPKPERAGEASPFNAWNVDATQIVFEHSDIYKGRVASLLAALVFDDEQKRRFPTQSSGEDTELRCAWMQTERD